jgi:hypothetical protein
VWLAQNTANTIAMSSVNDLISFVGRSPYSGNTILNKQYIGGDIAASQALGLALEPAMIIPGPQSLPGGVAIPRGGTASRFRTQTVAKL